MASRAAPAETTSSEPAQDKNRATFLPLQSIEGPGFCHCLYSRRIEINRLTFRAGVNRGSPIQKRTAAGGLQA